MSRLRPRALATLLTAGTAQVGIASSFLSSEYPDLSLSTRLPSNKVLLGADQFPQGLPEGRRPVQKNVGFGSGPWSELHVKLGIRTRHPRELLSGVQVHWPWVFFGVFFCSSSIKTRHYVSGALWGTGSLNLNRTPRILDGYEGVTPV